MLLITAVLLTWTTTCSPAMWTTQRGRTPITDPLHAHVCCVGRSLVLGAGFSEFIFMITDGFT